MSIYQFQFVIHMCDFFDFLDAFKQYLRLLNILTKEQTLLRML